MSLSKNGSMAGQPAASRRTLLYGDQQGTFRGVAARSNRDDSYFSGESNYVNHIIFTGYRYQCVEYARRFLLLTTGCVFDSCGRASEIYNMTKITHVETGETYPLIAHDNGKSTVGPEPGDIIIYPYDDEAAPWGHVGIISYVDDTRVGIAEQNQFFGSFISPSPDYLDGERCVGRYVDLHRDEVTGAWTLNETGGMPRSLGWLKYPGAPTRELIFAPFSPLPQYIAVRETPIDDPTHPYLMNLQLPAPLTLPIGDTVSEVYAFAQGSGHSAVAAVSAACRVVRFTLASLFSRADLTAAFLSLPTNPLSADITPYPPLDALFTEMAALGGEGGDEARLVPALAAYFGIPPEWVAAMQREYVSAPVHMFADFSFDMKAHEPDVRQAAERAAERKPGDAPVRIRVENPHDEAWHLFRVDFDAARMMVELPQLSANLPALREAAVAQLPGFRVAGMISYRFDFIRYLKRVDEERGRRTAFTIVLDAKEHMDEPRHALVKLMQSYCDEAKYPVRVVAESDLAYDAATGKLHAHITDASDAAAPATDFEVNFLFHLCSWEDVLVRQPEAHAALRAAALDYTRADVVFAKPLWSYLLSGLVHRSPAELASPDVGEWSHHERQPLSIRFFDIARRLFEYALPRQAAEVWDQEVSEFKGSCRRIGMVRPMPERPTIGMVASMAVVNFASSAVMAHTGGKLVYNPDGTQDRSGVGPSVAFHTFPSDD